jgi:hypothetical protein
MCKVKYKRTKDVAPEENYPRNTNTKLFQVGGEA